MLPDATPPKTLVIIKHNGGDFANQLWNYLSVYAYALERGYACENYSFFEYAAYFPALPLTNRFVRRVFFDAFTPVVRRMRRLTQHAWIVRRWRGLYALYVRLLLLLDLPRIDSGAILDEWGNYLLPPSAPATPALAAFERSDCDRLLLTGWLFRNPAGIEKYRVELARLFRPRPDIVASIDQRFASLRQKYRHCIGVHVRQRDYRTWKGGRFYLHPARIAEVVREYARMMSIDPADTCLVVCSDEPVVLGAFAPFAAVCPNGSAIEDFFSLSRCDAVIGSDSTFGEMACYFGNIPHITAKRGAMDWEYYRGKNGWFYNKYSFVLGTDASRWDIPL